MMASAASVLTTAALQYEVFNLIGLWDEASLVAAAAGFGGCLGAAGIRRRAEEYIRPWSEKLHKLFPRASNRAVRRACVHFEGVRTVAHKKLRWEPESWKAGRHA